LRRAVSAASFPEAAKEKPSFISEGRLFYRLID
jgi:hypothetical protein